MPVARFCVCGFLLPASDDVGRPCPACGRFAAPSVPAVKFEVKLPKLVDDDKPLGFQVVEVGNDGGTIPYLGPPQARSIEEDDRRRRLDEIDRKVQADKAWEEKPRRRRLRENPWPAAGSLQDCFTFPLRSILWVVILAWAWSIVLIVGLHCAARGWDFWIADVAVSAFAVLVLGFTHRLCQYAYASSSASPGSMLRWPTFNFVAEFKAGLIGLLGLLAGPIPVAALTFWFWLYGGRLLPVDRLILFELTTVALTWWLLVILSAHEFGAVHPLAIVRWFELRGWLSLAAIVAAMTAVTFILWFVGAAVSAGPFEGALVQVIFLPASLAWVFAIVFLLLRWLGVRGRVAGGMALESRL